MPLIRSTSPLRVLLALAIAALAGVAASLLAQVTGLNASPVLLLAPAAAALLGGVMPGLVAGLAIGAATRDPLVALSAAALALLCGRAGGRRRQDASTAGPAPRPADTPPPRGRVSAPAEHTTEATWRFQHEEPLDITLPEDEQVEHLYLHSFLAECNDAFARMYGFANSTDVVGTRLVVFLPPSDRSNPALLRQYIRSGYRLEDAESHEIDRYGHRKYFVNNLVGIFERGRVVGAWGTQRDVTAERWNQPSGAGSIVSGPVPHQE